LGCSLQGKAFISAIDAASIWEWQLLGVSDLSRWTESLKYFFKSLTQLTLRLGLIRRLTSLIRKLDRVGKLPRANPDLHCGYHACADLLGLNS
jgi:hypothetical protein